MPLAIGLDDLDVKTGYRYFSTDLLTNVVLAELSLTDVSYERSIKTAGSFSANIAIIPQTATMDIYETTMPGKTGLYVLRNGECVWGGIIWSRTYDIVRKTLSIQGLEFVSYLHHRLIWKTLNLKYEGATIIKSGATARVSLSATDTYAFAPNAPVRIDFYEISDWSYNGTYAVRNNQDLPSDLYPVSPPAPTPAVHGNIDLTSRPNVYNPDGSISTVLSFSFNDDSSTPAYEVIIPRISDDGYTLSEDEAIELYRSSGKHLGKFTTVAAAVQYATEIHTLQEQNITQDYFTISIPGLPNGTYTDASVSVRQDTYDYLRNMLQTLAVDFSNVVFPNDEIEPGSSEEYGINLISATNGIGRVTTSADHGLISGQTLQIKNLNSTYNGTWVVIDVISTRTVTFDLQDSSITVAASTPTFQTISVSATALVAYEATLTCIGANTLTPGDTVTVSGVDSGTLASPVFDGVQIVNTTTPISGSNLFAFSYTTASPIDIAIGAAQIGGTVTIRPVVVNSTFGSYPGNADLGIDYSTYAYSGNSVKEKQVFRGYELLNVGEKLDEYADALIGFEYRIDCAYDVATDSFTRTFVLVPIDFPNPPTAGEVSPISRYGADKLVFEYPGSISNLTIQESAENAATRFFVVGNDSELGEDASQPYSVAAATELLSDGWPLLDAEHDMQNETDESVLYTNAERYLIEARPPIVSITLNCNGAMYPAVGSYVPGDWCSLIVNDPFVQMRLANDLEPRDTVIVRKIDSYSVSVPNSPAFPETVSIVLIPEWQVDARGN